ncbi:hypothetical protein LUZ61_006183 [Rhynchospora tenuis]|uniref:YABBY protein C-terminal domain-containing protein n=1 Tax=Rhynchospora tenuis TaxID=198213 RepID=A0AAD6EVD0_9POAL|nr:hypothetical protein LUZ61_006183 [Rhynchospora tenuis]
MDHPDPAKGFTYTVCPHCKISLMMEMPVDMTKRTNVLCVCCNTVLRFNPDPDELQRITQKLASLTVSSNQILPPAAQSASAEPANPRAPFVVKPDPIKELRRPSAYNCFMREEIARIQASIPGIPHREAFIMASENWAKNDRSSSPTVSSSDHNFQLRKKCAACRSLTDMKMPHT